jgi:hypothetical protein
MNFLDPSWDGPSGSEAHHPSDRIAATDPPRKNENRRQTKACGLSHW